MPHIFDNQEFQADDYNNINNYDYNYKKYSDNEVEPLSKVDISPTIQEEGVLLSYGESNGVMPAGMFLLNGFVNSDGKRISEYEAFIEDGYALLKEMEIVDYHLVVKQPGNSLLVPIESFHRISSKSRINDVEFGQLLSREIHEPIDIEMINMAMAGYLARKPENTELSSFKFEGETLDAANAILIGPNGEQRGTNYTMIPFKAPKILDLIHTIGYKDLINENDLYKDEKIYNEMYINPDKSKGYRR